MKKSILLLCSLTFFLCFSGVAGAVPTTWTDLIDWNPDKFVWYDVTYTHDITDGPDGYQGGPLLGGDDRIFSYDLTLSLYDDGDQRRERVIINQPGWFADERYNFNYTDQEFGWSLVGVLQLNLFGELTVRIDRRKGDFYIDYSELNAYGDDGSSSAPIPEPATMLLLGTGLIGLTATSRKKRLKKK